ncbi:MAG: hypothetical protein DI563_10345 [Variovorax paradoxus]|uniref:Uncharacterized protein n=1 Tax=Variovorax paradoxus TaxID=34073 RepID=A0A2W5QDG5_VARPD|nr:MAG: hypothetical protein DI563_10345 [Variovorax paradoxus]
MFPLFWNVSYAPVYRWPGGGDWQQVVDTRTIVKALAGPGSSNVEVECRAVERYSYGRQLGWLTDALIGLQDDASPAEKKRARTAVGRLREAAEWVDSIKPQFADQRTARRVGGTPPATQ